MSKGKWKRNRSKHEVDRTQCKNAYIGQTKTHGHFSAVLIFFLQGSADLVSLHQTALHSNHTTKKNG